MAWWWNYMMERWCKRAGRRDKGDSNSKLDEDIPITPPLSPAPIDDEDVATKKSNEIRIGPITRAHEKLLEQQVNSLLIEPDVFLMRALYYLSLCIYV
jgi:hypothetical protein